MTSGLDLDRRRQGVAGGVNRRLSRDVCFRAVDDVGIGRQAGLRGVAKLLGDVGDRLSLPDQQGGERVAKVVRPCWGERVEGAPPPVPVVVLCPRFAVRAREHEAGRRTPAGRPPVL